MRGAGRASGQHPTPHPPRPGRIAAAVVRAAELIEEDGVVTRHRRNMRMVRRQGLVENSQRAPIKRLGLRIAAGVPVEVGEVVEPDGHGRVLGAEDLLAKRERFQVKFFCFLMTCFRPELKGKIADIPG